MQVMWRPHGRWILSRDADRVDPSPHDLKSKHVRNPILSEATDVRHVAWQGDITPNRTHEIKRVIRRAIDDRVDSPRHLIADR